MSRTRALRAFLSRPGTIIGLTMFGAILAGALLAPFLANQNPYNLAELDLMNSELPPLSQSSEGYTLWLGSDDQGRDLFSAILYGIRVSLMVAVISTAIALVIGTAIGLSAAYAGGAYDAVLMRLADVQLAFPGILIALVLLAVLGAGLDKVIIAIVAVQWAYYARVARSSAMVECSKEYVLAARGLRYSPPRIMLLHVLPNAFAPLAVVVAVETASAIALEATLSFLGIGLPITQPSLGLLIANGYSFMLTGAYWLSFYPGLVLVLLLVSINLIGEGLNQIGNRNGRG
jgi:peptide/nickel transport system permease protein